MSYGRSLSMKDEALVSRCWPMSLPKADALPGCAIPRNFAPYSRTMIAATFLLVNWI